MHGSESHPPLLLELELGRADDMRNARGADDVDVDVDVDASDVDVANTTNSSICFLVKETVGIAARWRHGRQPEDINDPMKDAADDGTVLPFSSSLVAQPSSSDVPPSSMLYTMTIGEAHAHYMDMVRDERFPKAHANVAYNHHLLEEQL
ncbi:hypothetical protein D1007_23692 [Hordeum vulgare]|nr:hypothetical protein D1007_23692 [Hordeum vulgare]